MSGQAFLPATKFRNARNIPAAIIVIGGSAGSLVPLRRIVKRLPAEFPAVVFIAQHSSPTWAAASSVELLQPGAAIPVHEVADVQPFQAGRIYLCPPNYHLTLESGLMRIEKSPIENHTRPSIDVLFNVNSSYG